ncbi:GNAT family N-acetyltransferase [Mesorhizobium xinjiangense]|uniref:GNAT family N-acetyltransferase n=1 Tax=Mesorhizobium xinjiangense TaxID=2678685 RepID=UPI001F1A6258|nr:GNAT family N-acetyltransferase [Mesorhizobium xinjiangense]
MNHSQLAAIEAITPEFLPRVLALNTAHATELSLLDAAGLSALVDEAFLALRIGDVEAFLIAFDQHAAYESPNFNWFRERYPRFVYVDRIAVAASARGRGHARRLYEHLFDRARDRGHDVVTCEVNAEPPNPASDAFYAALGFEPVGEAAIHGGAKSVRYFERQL